VRYCSNCRSNGCRVTLNGLVTNNSTIRDVIYTQHHRSSAFALIRGRARTAARKYGMNSCSICGYSRHVEVSHKRAISSFPLDTPVSVVNSRDNIWPLCPNHHLEFDNGVLGLDSDNVTLPRYPN
jgi:predicted restriction endonuclease